MRQECSRHGFDRASVAKHVLHDADKLQPGGHFIGELDGQLVHQRKAATNRRARQSEIGCWQTPSEFAAMAVFLDSDHAVNITGQTINIDGGQVMHS